MKVTDISVNAFWKGEVRIQGAVEEDNHSFKTKLYIKGSQIFDYSCSCAQGNSFKGMCEHCKLLNREYLNFEKLNQKKMVSTSPAVRHMIREYTNREVAKIMGEEETKKVRLVPRLFVSRQNIKLECMVGRSRLYQIKDLSAFAQAVENGQNVSYGKELSFHHSISAFDAESEPLVRLILELSGSYKEHFEEIRSRNGAGLTGVRSLTLNRTACDRFFAIMKDREITVEDLKGQVRSVKLLRANPPLTIDVRNEGGEGVRVSVSGELFSFSGERCLYVMDACSLYQCDEIYTDALTIFLTQICGTQGTDNELLVNNRDLPLFYERVLLQLETLGLLKEEGIDLENYRPEKLKARFEFNSLSPNEVSLNPLLSYGEYSFHPLDDEHVRNTICRDVPEEFRISQLITRYFKYKEDGTKNLVIRDNESEVYRLLDEGIEQFKAVGEVYFSDSFKHLKILPPPEVSVGVSMNSGWLELTIEAEGMSRLELSRVLSEYTAKKKYYRLKNGEFLKLDDEGLLTVSRLAAGLSLGKSELQEKTIRLESFRALYVDSVMKEDSRIAYQRDSRFRSIVRGMKSVEDSSFELPKEFNGTLRAYQKIGFRWLKTLDEYGFGGILADDMGLGKTIQMISLLIDFSKQKEGEQSSKEKTSLIVCPASLIYNWCHEFSDFAPTLRILPVAGTAGDRRESLLELERMEKSGEPYDVVVTSFDLLKRDLSFYKEKTFRCVVIDEAQYIKNFSTQSARAVKSVPAISRFALTGTPIENRLSELWSIFDFLMPGFLFGYRKFKTMFELPIVKEGDKQALENLHRMIRPFVLRRLKSDVLKELPEKLEKIVYSAFEGKQKELYTGNALRLKESIETGTMDADGTGKIKILAELTKLRQLCCDPSLCYEGYESGSAKLDTCMDLLTGAVEAGHSVLLFSQFASMLEIIGRHLEGESIPYYKLTGSTSKEERNRLVNSFQNGEAPVFLISLKAGGTGLNLTAADIVIHYDPWWNVAAQNQATDRAHRIGQSQQVTVYKLIMKKTIEENILKLQEAKKDLAEQIVTEGMVSLASLGKQELLEILK